MMRMKKWKWLAIHFVAVITFFSCAAQHSAIKPVEETQERALSTTTAIREKSQAQSDRRDSKLPRAADPSVPSVRKSDIPATAQPSAGVSRDVQSATVNPLPSPAKSGAARKHTYTDYRSKVLPTARKKQASDPSTLGEDGEDFVGLKFDNADVKEVIAAIAEMTGIKYIVDPGIEGQVTIHTAGGVAKENLLSVFYLILEANGLTAVKDGEFYRITAGEDASRLPIQLRLQIDGKPSVRKSEIVTQIIPLQYISAAEMSQLLKPFLSDKGTIISHEGSNTLLVVDTGINIMKALKLVEAFDIGLFEKTNHHFFFLKNVDAEEVVKILEQVFAPTMQGRIDGVKFIPIKRLNSILALSPDKRMFNNIQQLLRNLDAATLGIEPRIHVYFVKNGSALDLANLLNQVFAGSITTGEGEKRLSSSPLPKKPSFGQMQDRKPVTAPGLIIQEEVRSPIIIQEEVRSSQAAAPAEATKEVATESTSLKGVIKITPDEIRNALIIEATPADYRVIINVLKTIDVLPRQVLIEATIAEIDYSLITDLGVNWEYLKGANFGKGLLNLSSSGSGLTFAVGIADELRATLNALEQQNRANILSSPHVLASDNREARIDVSTEVPTVTASTVIPSGGQSITTTTVQYRDTGVLLAVTPHINERGLVTMDIFQEVSEQSADVVVAGDAFPSFFKRVVQTSLTVQHGQTIVLGGLIRENKSKTSSGVPWFARLPIIGFIFGQTQDAFDKTELIILLTPKVIVNLEDVDIVTDEFKLKVDSVVRDMYEKRSVQ
jgi:general secretion pathway protein D